MKTPNTEPTAATFVVRMWAEHAEGQAAQWRGQVEHVQTGEKEYFQRLGKLLEFISHHLDSTLAPRKQGMPGPR